MTGFFSFRSVPRFQRDRSQAGRRLHHAVHELQRRVRRVRHVHVPDLRRDVGPRARHRAAARRRVPVQRRRAVSRHRARRRRRRHAFIGAEDHLQQRREPRRVRLFYRVVMKAFLILRMQQRRGFYLLMYARVVSFVGRDRIRTSTFCPPGPKPAGACARWEDGTTVDQNTL